MYCLDTNIVVDSFRGDEKLKSKIVELKDSFFEISITPITLCELYKGAYLYHNPEKALEDINEFISFFDMLDFDVAACKKFGEIYASLSKVGKMIPESDLMIVGIAKTNDLILVTRDKKHFKDCGIKVEEW